MGPLDMFRAYRAFNKLESAWNKSVWRKNLMGWKTITGAGIIAASVALRYLESAGVCSGCGAIAEGLQALGEALGLVGLRHAIAKNGG